MSSQVRILGVAMAVLLCGAASAAPAPTQRGEVQPPLGAARAVVSLCGLAVMLVEDHPGTTATVYTGPAIDERLAAAAAAGYGELELADVYTPVAAVCDIIRAEHERVLRKQEARREP